MVLLYGVVRAVAAGYGVSHKFDKNVLVRCGLDSASRYLNAVYGKRGHRRFGQLDYGDGNVLRRIAAKNIVAFPQIVNYVVNYAFAVYVDSDAGLIIRSGRVRGGRVAGDVYCAFCSGKGKFRACSRKRTVELVLVKVCTSEKLNVLGSSLVDCFRVHIVYLRSSSYLGSFSLSAVSA